MVVIQSLGRAAVNLLWAGAFTLAAASLGARVMRLARLEPQSAYLRWAIALGLGLGLLAYLVLCAGLLGLLHLPLPLFVLLVCLLIGWNFTVEALRFGKSIVAGLWQMVRKGTWRHRSLVAVIVSIACLSLLGALGPARGVDSLTVHLALPKTYLRAGRIVYFPSNFNTTYPAATDMLFLLGMWGHSVQVAQLFNWVFSFTMALVVYGLARQLMPQGGALLAVGLLYAITDIAYQSSIALVDIGVAAWQVLAFVAFYLWYRGPGCWQWATLAGLFAGFAGGSKYTGLIVALILGLFILVVTMRRWSNLASATRWLPAVSFAGAALLGVLPWYARSWILTGNPVYPYFLNLFPPRAPGAHPELLQQIIKHAQTVDVGEIGIVRVLSAPWVMTVYAPRSGKIGPLFLACAPLMVIWLGRVWRVVSERDLDTSSKADKYCLQQQWTLVVWILVFGVLFEILWASTYLRVRTALALFALLSVPAALVILAPPLGRGQIQKAVHSLLSVLVGLWFVVALGAAARLELKVLKPVFGLESEPDYLARVLPQESGFYSYEDFTYINENTPESSRILIRDFVSYYLDRDYILMGGLFWYPGLSAGTLEDPARLRAALDDLGVTHFVIRKGRLGEPAPDKPWFQRLAKALESMPEIRLLRSSEFNNIYVLEN